MLHVEWLCGSLPWIHFLHLRAETQDLIYRLPLQAQTILQPARSPTFTGSTPSDPPDHWPTGCAQDPPPRDQLPGDHKPESLDSITRDCIL
ncbi:hypothetical protein CHARACLAT_017633 [Characodon lateralis]|uniref:Uncharacterized protein n=1 Tax=Characodon lateralis TaxID=208331 RepID=A0ABU7CS73_9TELE|nr:hypothetical protein [Characodon lateralis]